MEFSTYLYPLPTTHMKIIQRAQSAIEKYLNQKGGDSPGEVSQDRLVLSAIYAQLGSMVADVKKDAEMKDFEASRQKVDAYRVRRKSGETATDSKAYSELDCEKAIKESIDAKCLAKKYELLHRGVGEILNSLASRIKVLEMEARNQS